MDCGSIVKVGMYVPQSSATPEAALKVADAAERSEDIDGLFVFDHLFEHRVGGSYAMSAMPLAAALVARTHRLTVGTLVMRIGVVPDALLYSQLMTLHALARGNFIAGLGVGDSQSAPEDTEYAIVRPPLDERLHRIGELALRLRVAGVEVWLGGRSVHIRTVAQQTGASVNQWDCELTDLKPTDTWGGKFRDAAHVQALAGHGVPWSVFLGLGSSEDPQGAVDLLSGAVAS